MSFNDQTFKSALVIKVLVPTLAYVKRSQKVEIGSLLRNYPLSMFKSYEAAYEQLFRDMEIKGNDICKPIKPSIQQENNQSINLFVNFYSNFYDATNYLMFQFLSKEIYWQAILTHLTNSTQVNLFEVQKHIQSLNINSHKIQEWVKPGDNSKNMENKKSSCFGKYVYRSSVN